MGTNLPQWVVILVLLVLVSLLVVLALTNPEKAYPVILMLGGLIGGFFGLDQFLRRGSEDKK